MKDTADGTRVPRVSVLVPIKNEEAAIGQMLQSLLRQDYPAEHLEVLLIDGRSSDKTLEIIESVRREHSGHTHMLRVIDNPAQIVSTALNLGIEHATGEIIVRMDAHAEYAPDYVSACVRCLERTGAWNVGGPARTKAKGRLQRAIAAAYHSPFSVGGARFHDDAHEGDVDTVTYGCWKKSTLVQLGGFDEELIRNQDDELNYRIVRAGGSVYQSPDIRSWYYPRSSLRTLFKQYYQYGFWKVGVIRKHRMPASMRHLVPIAFVCGLLVGPVVSLLHPAVMAAYLGSIGVYLALAVVFSCAAARRHGWDLVPVLPVVFGTYHIAYGAGFLMGIRHFAVRGRSRKTGTAFHSISR